MQHFAENDLIKSIVHIATENKGKGATKSPYVHPTHMCKTCFNSVSEDITIFCSECIFSPYKHQIEKTNLAQVNQVLSRLRNKR